VNKGLNFGGDLDHRLDVGIVFRTHHYWEIKKVVNGHKSAAHTDLPDGGTGKMCLGRGMHSPSAPGLFVFLLPPCVADADIIFLPCGFFYLLLLSSPNLSRHRLNVYHTSTHGVALVQI